MNTIASNFYEIIISKNEMKLPYILYVDAEQLENLRNTHPNLTFTKNKDKIFYWGTNDNILKEDGVKLLNATFNSYIFLRIIEKSLFKQFYLDADRFKCKKKIYYKVILLEQDISDNQFKGLRFHKCFSFNFQPLFFNNQIHLGLTISYSVKEVPYWTKSEFIAHGVECNNLDFDEETGIVFNSLKTILCLAKHFNYTNARKLKLDTLNSIENEHKEINAFIQTFFINNKKLILLPNELEITDFKHYSADSKLLSEPESYFYKGKYPNFENTYNKRQKIGFNKPFSYDEFENKPIRIGVIYPKTDYSSISNFFKSVQDELISTLKIKKENFQYDKIEIDDYTLESYQETISQVKKSDIVIIVITKEHESLLPSLSPYFFCKLKFLEQGLNVQDIQIEQIKKYLQDKKTGIANYSPHNLALNIYAKLGGMAWTIKPNDPKNELIIGVGATTDQEGQPMMGLATIFRGDGKYLFGNLFGQINTVTSMDSYRNDLQKILINNIQKYIQDGIIETRKPFHLIFHIFKPTGKDNEIKALENVINQFSNYTFDYTFVHIGDGHNYRFFAQNIDRKNRRGLYVKVNDILGFLCLTSISSNFCKIEIDKRSSKIDLEAITKQVYEFAELSHTSYNKSGKPVTIKYPNLMASFAEKFGQINGSYLKKIQMSDNSLWFI